MPLSTLPRAGDRYDWRWASEHETERHTIVVLGVLGDGARTWVAFRYEVHKRGRRDAAILSLDEFEQQYPYRLGGGS